MNYLFLSGSFRKKSSSLAILENIKPFFTGFEAGTTHIEIPRLDKLPFYSNDLDEDKPDIVKNFIAQVARADGIVCCTPEYNHSLPAVIKNAIDWASRPAFKSELKDKPITIITQAQSPVGGARAQAHLKLVLDSTLSCIHTRHEMLITPIMNVLDDNMNITDEKIISRLERHIIYFQNFVNTVKKVN